VLCSLETYANIGSYYDNGLASEVRVFRGCDLPTLVLDELEKSELTHDIRQGMRGKLDIYASIRQRNANPVR